MFKVMKGLKLSPANTIPIRGRVEDKRPFDPGRNDIMVNIAVIFSKGMA